MDFHSLTRKELQLLCKKNKIPANITNIAMADALQALPKVEGLDEFINVSKSDHQQSPERSMAESPAIPRTTCRTSTRRKISVESQSSQSVISTRRITRRTATREDNVVSQEQQGAVANTPANQAFQKRASAVSARRKVEDQSQGTSVQRTYSTRQSVRLLEKSLTEMSLTENGKFEPKKVDGLDEESKDLERKEDYANGSDSGEAPQKILPEKIPGLNLYQSLENEKDFEHELLQKNMCNEYEVENCCEKVGEESNDKSLDKPDLLQVEKLEKPVNMSDGSIDENGTFGFTGSDDVIDENFATLDATFNSESAKDKNGNEAAMFVDMSGLNAGEENNDECLHKSDLQDENLFNSESAKDKNGNEAAMFVDMSGLNAGKENNDECLHKSDLQDENLDEPVNTYEGSIDENGSDDKIGEDYSTCDATFNFGSAEDKNDNEAARFVNMSDENSLKKMESSEVVKDSDDVLNSSHVPLAVELSIESSSLKKRESSEVVKNSDEVLNSNHVPLAVELSDEALEFSMGMANTEVVKVGADVSAQLIHHTPAAEVSAPNEIIHSLNIEEFVSEKSEIDLMKDMQQDNVDLHEVLDVTKESYPMPASEETLVSLNCRSPICSEVIDREVSEKQVEVNEVISSPLVSTEKHTTIPTMSHTSDTNKENIDYGDKKLESKKKIIDEAMSLEKMSLRKLTKMLKELNISSKNNEEKNVNKVAKTRVALQTLPENSMPTFAQENELQESLEGK